MKVQHVGNECPVGKDEMVRVYLLGDLAPLKPGPASGFHWGPGLGPEGEGRIESYEVLRANVCPCAPGRCSASPQGRDRGFMSVLSDIECRAAKTKADPEAQDLLRAVMAWSAVTGIATTAEQRALLVDLYAAMREVAA